MLSIPFLILYATGYRFERANLISTGGMYVSAERTGAEIYVDGELVRETRVFRRAFYAQNLYPGTHRVHVQREGSHTWVKELPVYAHIVTEAQAFNLALIPEARVITAWQTEAGLTVVPPETLLHASTTQELFLATTTATSTFSGNTEYELRADLFVIPTTTPASPATKAGLLSATTTVATSSISMATTTKEISDVRLFERGDDVYAAWVGSREDMPYYYCAEPFESLGTSTEPLLLPSEAAATAAKKDVFAASVSDAPVLDNPVQEVPPEKECVPEIRLDRKGQKVRYFDFFPGSTDFVVMVLEGGVYVVEVDARAWQNVQPMMEGQALDARVDGGRVYIKDGSLIYEMILE